jgi:hypothetical protein
VHARGGLAQMEERPGIITEKYQYTMLVDTEATYELKTMVKMPEYFP